MQEPPVPLDPGFVVEWQLSDEAPVVIDLSESEPEVLLPDDETAGTGIGVTI